MGRNFWDRPDWTYTAEDLAIKAAYGLGGLAVGLGTGYFFESLGEVVPEEGSREQAGAALAALGVLGFGTWGGVRLVNAGFSGDWSNHPADNRYVLSSIITVGAILEGASRVEGSMTPSPIDHMAPFLIDGLENIFSWGNE